jgi:DMSO/TMAO reductase YedYZ molybdopterin-dependent catalytic subunit
VTFTVECSGNTGLPFFWGGIGNARWAGTPLAGVLQEAGILDQGKEIVFYGTDIGKEKVRDYEISQPMARAMSVMDRSLAESRSCSRAPCEVGHGSGSPRMPMNGT